MGVNVLLFLIFQIAIEPWRRKRLVKGFEDKVMEALEREIPLERATLDGTPPSEALPLPEDTAQDPRLSVPQRYDTTLALVDEVMEELPPASLGALEPRTLVSEFEDFKADLRDRFSERPLVVRRLDLTRAALEGAAAGIALTSVIAWLLRPR